MFNAMAELADTLAGARGFYRDRSAMQRAVGVGGGVLQGVEVGAEGGEQREYGCSIANRVALRRLRRTFRNQISLAIDDVYAVTNMHHACSSQVSNRQGPDAALRCVFHEVPFLTVGLEQTTIDSCVLVEGIGDWFEAFDPSVVGHSSHADRISCGAAHRMSQWHKDRYLIERWDTQIR